MREIKFRAWDKKEEIMCYNANHLSPDWFSEHLNLVPMQYTGLKDKNGKETYFDDVLKWRGSTFRIIWDDKCACVMLKRLSGADGMSEIPAHNIKDSEVIGNIYENPELLEADNG